MNILHLDGVVGWDIDAKEFSNTLDSMTGDITFELNSGGGYVTDGVAILNKIRAYNRGKTTANISYSASMMTQIALACDEVNVYDNAIFMIHNVQGVVFGDHNDMRESAELQERMSNMLAQMYCKKTKKSLEEIKQMMDNDTFLFGSDIVEQGFADNVIDTEKGSSDDKDMLVNHAKDINSKVMKAMREEKLSLSDLKSSFTQCMGNCNLDSRVANPSDDTVKLANKGNAMDFNKDNFDLLMESRQHLNANIEMLNNQLKDSAETLESLKAENTTLSTQVEMADARVSEVEARIREAFACGCDADTIVAMVNAEDSVKASEIVNGFRASNGATSNSDVDVEKVNAMPDLMAYAQLNKGKIR